MTPTERGQHLSHWCVIFDGVCDSYRNNEFSFTIMCNDMSLYKKEMRYERLEIFFMGDEHD